MSLDSNIRYCELLMSPEIPMVFVQIKTESLQLNQGMEGWAGSNVIHDRSQIRFCLYMNR